MAIDVPTKSTQVRIGAGLIASVAIFLLLDRVLPIQATSLTAVLVRMSVCAFLAFAIGGFIAKRNFVGVAGALAAFAWVGVTGYSIYLGSNFDQSAWDSLIWNLPSSVLIMAAVAGALAGTFLASRQPR